MPDKNNNGSLIIPMEDFERDPDEIAQVLSILGFVPFSAESDVDVGMFHMVGFSRRFRSLAFGEEPPFYSIKLNRDNDNKIVDVILSEMNLDNVVSNTKGLKVLTSSLEEDILENHTDTSVSH